MRVGRRRGGQTDVHADPQKEDKKQDVEYEDDVRDDSQALELVG